MNKEIKKALDARFKGLQTQLAAAQKSGATKKELLKLHKGIKKQGRALERFEAAMRKEVIETVLVQYEAHLIKNADRLKEIMKTKSGMMEFIPKAVGDMTTGSGIDATTAPVNMHTSLGGFNLRNDNSLLSLCTVTKTSKDSLKYTELEPKEGSYAMVAEGGAKPQIDFKWTNRFATPKKAAAHEVLSEEVATDVKRMVSVAKQYLQKQHDLFKVNQVFFGDNTGENLEGATTIGRVFAAGAMALKVVTPNFMDAVNAVITDIYTTHNYTDEASYEANIVLVNPVDFYLELVSAKDGNQLPLYPQAGLFNSVTIGGVTIKPWSKIPAGQIFVADMTRYNIVNYIGFSIRTGWVNNQFITNQFTMIGESRFFGYVKNLDRQAFVYDAIATIKTAITKI